MDKLEEILAAAAEHGAQSEPDHEVGDLQDVLSYCWAKLSEKNREEVYKHFKPTIDAWLTDDVKIRYEEQANDDTQKTRLKKLH